SVPRRRARTRRRRKADHDNPLEARRSPDGDRPGPRGSDGRHLHEEKSPGVVSRLARDKKGQVLVEYALLLALISVVSIGVLASLGLDIRDVLLQASSRMSQVSNP